MSKASQTGADSEPESSSASNVSVEEKMDQLDIKERKEEHQFQFRFSSQPDPYVVACDTSMTMLKALNTSETFRKEENTRNTKKEIVIQRADGAAVKTDFPCCLIEKDEIVIVTFIEKEKNLSTEQQTHKALPLPRTDLITFKIQTTGGTGVFNIMKNSKLKMAAYVCVYAQEGENIETSLKSDGRFIDKIFLKHCVLSLELDNSKMNLQRKYEMSNPVKSLDKMTFKIIAIDRARPDSQIKQTEVKIKSDKPLPSLEKDNPEEHPTSTEQKQTLHNTESTSLSTKWPVIPDSTEILEILRAQFKDLLETLAKRKNSEDQKTSLKPHTYFRAEYDKSVQSFSEVYKIKQLMRLSDSVCQIRVEGSARGTGFLLFDRFILTNAHVIGKFDPFTRKLSKTFTAVFGYEDLKATETKCVVLKEHVAAYFYGKVKDRYLDFALLELDDVNEISGRPGLLSRYTPGPPPNRGGICIVGHPDGWIKKADPCFIIENLKEAADKHISENSEFIHVMTQQSFEEKWDIYENQITYDSCFFHGSSGSPVFDEDCCLIGVHTGGYVYPGRKGKRSIMEYAYSMQPILEGIITQAKKSDRSDILKSLSGYESLNLNLGDNDVDMKEYS